MFYLNEVLNFFYVREHSHNYACDDDDDHDDDDDGDDDDDNEFVMKTTAMKILI